MPLPGSLVEAIQHYLAGESTEEEDRLVNQWYHSFSDEDPIEVPITARLLKEQVGQRLLQRVLRSVHVESPEFGQPPVPAVPLWRRSVARMSVAAAVLVAVSIGGFYWLRPSPAHGTVAGTVARTAIPAARIKPGGDKAILTLGTGQQLLLDSVPDDHLAMQGNTRVEKIKGGQLIYQSRGDQPAAVTYNTLTTPRGGQYRVRLSDGTLVWLNAASALKYPTAFTGSDRTVELTGEAYFEVAPDQHQPFFVRHNGLLVTVLGTHFDVDAYPDEPTARVTLLEGAVNVSNGTAVKKLHPGQQVLLYGATIAINEDADAEQVIAWKNGRFQFDGATIESVMRELSRWYDVDVEYAGEKPIGHFIGEISRTDDIFEVLRMLSQTRSVHFKIEGKTIIVMQ